MEFKKEDLHFMVIGKQNIGKTMLSKALILKDPQSFDMSNTITTPTVSDLHFSESLNPNLQFHDSGGREAFDEVRKTSYDKRGIEYKFLLVCFSWDDRESFRLISKKYLPEIRKSHAKSKRIPAIMIIGCKDDFKQNSEISEEDVESLVKKFNLKCFVSVSCRMKTNLKHLQELLVSLPFESQESKKKKKLKYKAEESALPLHMHIASGEYETVKTLIEEGADLNCRTKGLNTPLHYACAFNELQIVELILRCKEVDTNAMNSDKETPLHIASKFGHVEIVQLLITKGGANLNQLNQSGEHSIDLAFNFETQEVLIEQRYKEERFLEYLSEGNHTKEVNDLMDSISLNHLSENPLKILLPQQGNNELIERIFSRGIELSSHDTEELFCKCHEDHLERFAVYFLQKRRDSIFKDMLSNEKTFTDDLFVLVQLFVDPIVKKLKSYVRTEQYQKRVSVLYDCILKMQKQSTEFLKILMKANPAGSLCTEIVIVSFLKERMNYQLFIQFIESFLPLQELVKQKTELMKFEHFIQKKEQEIPEPRPKSFWFLLKKPQIQLMKYKAFLERLIKDCTEKEIKTSVQSSVVSKQLIQSSSSISSLSSLEGLLKETLTKLSAKNEILSKSTAKMKEENSLLEISRLLHQKYGYKHLLKQDSQHEYVYHEMGVRQRWRRGELMKGQPRNKQGKIDVFLCSDVLFFGDLNGKRLVEHSVQESKIIFYFNYDSIRIQIFDLKDTKQLEDDLMLQIPHPRRWIQPIEEGFKEKNKKFYFCNVLIINNEYRTMSMRRDFLGFHQKRKEDFISVREVEIERLKEEKQMIEEEIKQLEIFNEKFQQRLEQQQKLREKKQNEINERVKRASSRLDLRKGLGQSQTSLLMNNKDIDNLARIRAMMETNENDKGKEDKGIVLPPSFKEKEELDPPSLPEDDREEEMILPPSLPKEEKDEEKKEEEILLPPSSPPPEEKIKEDKKFMANNPKESLISSGNMDHLAKIRAMLNGGNPPQSSSSSSSSSSSLFSTTKKASFLSSSLKTNKTTPLKDLMDDIPTKEEAKEKPEEVKKEKSNLLSVGGEDDLLGKRKRRSRSKSQVYFESPIMRSGLISKKGRSLMMGEEKESANSFLERRRKRKAEKEKELDLLVQNVNMKFGFSGRKKKKSSLMD